MSINPTNSVSAPVSTPDATNKPTPPISSSKNDTVKDTAKDTIDLKKTGCFEAFAKAICDFLKCLLNCICCRSPQPEQNDTVKDTVKSPPSLPPVWPIPVTPGQDPLKDFEDAVNYISKRGKEHSYADFSDHDFTAFKKYTAAVQLCVLFILSCTNPGEVNAYFKEYKQGKEEIPDFDEEAISNGNFYGFREVILSEFSKEKLLVLELVKYRRIHDSFSDFKRTCIDQYQKAVCFCANCGTVTPARMEQFDQLTPVAKLIVVALFASPEALKRAGSQILGSDPRLKATLDDKGRPLFFDPKNPPEAIGNALDLQAGLIVKAYQLSHPEAHSIFSTDSKSFL